MDQFQGAIVDDKGQPLLTLHISMRVNGAKWKGVIESATPVPIETRPVEGNYYKLRLADGRQKTIHMGHVTLMHSSHGDFIKAPFDSSAPPAQ